MHKHQYVHLLRSSILKFTSLIVAAGFLLAVPNATFATHTVDIDQDGFISVAEGVPFYGGIKVSLTETGDTSPASALALDRFPVADSDGDYYYQRTFTLSDEDRDSIADGHVIIHGIDIDHSGAYDGEKESSIAAGVPFEATVPAACGLINKGNNNSYTVDLNQLNSTGVDGYATLTLNGNTATIHMNVYGASANLPHAQHIHIGGIGECPPNTVGVSMMDNDDTSGNFSSRFEERRERMEKRFEERRERMELRFKEQTERMQQRFEERRERMESRYKEQTARIQERFSMRFNR